MYKKEGAKILIKNFYQPELTISKVKKQLLIAKKATTLGKQFLAILTIVNRYPSGSVPTDIHTELLKYDHILQLIKLLNRICLNEIPGESVGIKYYLDTFGPTKRIDGTKNVLFAFWMAFYHGGLCLGAPIGLLTSLILNQ